METGEIKHTYGYRFDRENRSMILERSLMNYHCWRSNIEAYKFDPPEEFDPRGVLFLENQLGIGACQDNSLADAVEHAHWLHTAGELVQLSRSFAYASSQEFDGLLDDGDVGSTLNGGTKTALQGIPLEEKFPYTDNHRQLRADYLRQKSTILADTSSLYRLEGEVPLGTEEDCYTFLGSLSGPIQIGVLWGIPDAWEITSWSPTGGGHAVLLVGYLRVEAWAPWGYGYLCKNSWGKDWGRSGYCLFHPKVVKQMLQHRWTVFVGRSIPKTPQPSNKPIDL